MFGFLRGKVAPPAGPDGAPQADVPAPAGDLSTHTGPSPFRRAPSDAMRRFEDLEQPPQGVPYTDPRHNLEMLSRFAYAWFGGRFPNQPLPDWSLVAQSNLDRFHAPLTDVQVKDRESRTEKSRGILFPTAVVNPPQYLRHGGAAPIGIGPEQITQFRASTDSMRPAQGNGPGSTFVNTIYMGQGFAAET